jgi:hypothetical protein
MADGTCPGHVSKKTPYIRGSKSIKKPVYKRGEN